jgi:hypothetical protein
MEGNYDAQKTQRIQQLEALLKGFEERLSTQAQEIIQSQMQAGDPSTISVPTGPYLQLASGQSIHDFMSNLFNEKETQKQGKSLECGGEKAIIWKLTTPFCDGQLCDRA